MADQNEMKVQNSSVFERPKPGDKIIWQYWDQTENRTDISQGGARSMMEQTQYLHETLKDSKWKYFYVSRFNVWDFLDKDVDLPADFNEYKWNKIAQKADMVRVALLNKYGGIYVDATICALQSFDVFWDKLYTSDKLEYLGWKNKAPVKAGFEYSVWFMCCKPKCKLVQAWHAEHQKVLAKLTQIQDDGSKFVMEQHPMYLDFGDECLKKLVPIISAKHPDCIRILHANGCWQSQEEVSESDWELYNKIIDDLIPKTCDPRHAHYYREAGDKLPIFVKIHRGNQQGGTFEDWIKKPGPWFSFIREYLKISREQ